MDGERWRSWEGLVVGMVVLLLGFWPASASRAADSDRVKNGFDLTSAIVEPDKIRRGGPPRDGIPAIDRPRLLPADNVDFVSGADRILGLVMGNTARAYPVRILNWHEIVNDRIEGKAVVISYCPLCGTGMAFLAEAEGRQLGFGVSGLLYNSDVLFYDRQTESLWSQILGRAISGLLVGTELHPLPLQHTSWQRWRQQYPQTTVLSTDTGYARDYRKNPYAGYASCRQIYFPLGHELPEGLHPKAMVMGIEVDGRFKAYPFSELEKHGRSRFSDDLNGQRYWVHWDQGSQSARITDMQDDELPVVQGFWFAWFAFHPDTTLFKAAEQK